MTATRTGCAAATVKAFCRRGQSAIRALLEAALPPALTYSDIGIYCLAMARSATTSDVFNAIAEADRRAILSALIGGEKAVGAIVTDLSMSQPQVSKHLRVLSEVGLVTSRAEGRHRLYRLEPTPLRPVHDWLAKFEQAWNSRLDRVDDYLHELQQQGELR